MSLNAFRKSLGKKRASFIKRKFFQRNLGCPIKKTFGSFVRPSEDPYCVGLTHDHHTSSLMVRGKLRIINGKILHLSITTVLRVAKFYFYFRRKLYTSKNSNLCALWFSLPRKYTRKIRLGHQKRKIVTLVKRRTHLTFPWILTSALQRLIRSLNPRHQKLWRPSL